ncbi:MAG: phage minor capsid protein [Lachnospiraceae bacterium]
MLPERLSEMSLLAEKHFQDLQNRILEDIVRRIRKTGEITSTADYQIQKLQMFGNTTEFIESEIKKTLKATDAQMWELYDEVIEKDYTRSKSLYEQVNSNFIPYADNEIMQSWAYAIGKQAESDLKNITNSMGLSIDVGGGRKAFTPLSTYYQRNLDSAAMDVLTGSFDYQSVLRKLTKEMTASGIRTVNYASGRADRITVASRRALMTGVNQLSSKINDYNAEKLGTEYFEVTYHAGHRDSHWWGGMVFNRNDLETVCGLGSAGGLCGVNCRHNYYAFVPDVSVRTYTDRQLEEMEANEQIERQWGGKGYNAYSATQKQRQMEVTMQAQRQRVRLLQKGGADPNDIVLAQGKYQQQLYQYTTFSNRMQIPQQRERIYIDGLGKVVANDCARGIIKRKSTLQAQVAYELNGEKSFIPKGTTVSSITTIAGKGSGTVLRVEPSLIKANGGELGEWSKKAGKVNSQKYSFDVHWYERNSKQYGAKVKNRREL